MKYSAGPITATTQQEGPKSTQQTYKQDWSQMAREFFTQCSINHVVRQMIAVYYIFHKEQMFILFSFGR